MPPNIPRRLPASSARALWPWTAGAVLGLLVVGSPFGGDARLNLDLVAIGDLEIPRSLFGIGAELPRWPMLEVVFAALSPPLGDASVKGLWMVAIVAVAFAGVEHHLRSLPWTVRVGAATVYALSPFLLTRIGVGHLAMASAAAWLPWAFDDLVDPFVRRRATVVHLAVFSLLGYYGALVALPLIVVGVLVRHRALSVVELLGVALLQIPWLVPALLTPGSRGDVAGSASFQTEIRTVGDLALVPIGHGFWLRSQDIGGRHAGALALVALLVAFAFTGALLAPIRHRASLLIVGTIGALGSTASTIPGIDRAFDAITRRPVFAPVRESQKLAVFVVFALVVLAANGAALFASTRPRARIIRGAWAGGVVALGLSVAAPHFGGLDGRVEAVDIPSSWFEAASNLDGAEGATVVLPWRQYVDLRIADGRRVHQPLPFLLPGDVVFRHDLALPGVPPTVARDRREPGVTALLGALRMGEPIGERLDRLGITHVVVLPAEAADDLARLRATPELVTVVDTDDLVVFAVREPGQAPQTESSGLPETANWRTWVTLGGLAVWLASGLGLARRETAQ